MRLIRLFNLHIMFEFHSTRHRYYIIYSAINIFYYLSSQGVVPLSHSSHTDMRPEQRTVRQTPGIKRYQPSLSLQLSVNPSIPALAILSSPSRPLLLTFHSLYIPLSLSEQRERTTANQSARNADAISAEHEYNFPKIPERKKL